MSAVEYDARLKAYRYPWPQWVTGPVNIPDAKARVVQGPFSSGRDNESEDRE